MSGSSEKLADPFGAVASFLAKLDETLLQLHYRWLDSLRRSTTLALDCDSSHRVIPLKSLQYYSTGLFFISE